MAMQIRFWDSFGHYTGNVNQKWTSSAYFNISVGNGRRGGNAAGSATTGTAYLYKSSLPNDQDFVVNVAASTSDLLGGYALIAVYDGTTVQVDMVINADGTISVRRGGSTVLATSTAKLLVAGYHSYEFLGHIASSTNGWAKLVVDGAVFVDVTSVSTQQTANAYVNRVQLNRGTYNTYFCDFVYRGGSGLDKVADLWGDIKVDYQQPNAAGNYGTWTVNGGSSRLDDIDDATPNGDTKYNSSSNAGDRDSFGFPATGSGAVIKGGAIVLSMRKDEVGARSVKPFTRQGSTDYDGDAIALGDTYGWYYKLLAKQGDGVTPWTKSDWDAMEVGYKLEA